MYPGWGEREGGSGNFPGGGGRCCREGLGIFQGGGGCRGRGGNGGGGGVRELKSVSVGGSMLSKLASSR